MDDETPQEEHEVLGLFWGIINMFIIVGFCSSIIVAMFVVSLIESIHIISCYLKDQWRSLFN